jgi:hypothetical protein
MRWRVRCVQNRDFKQIYLVVSEKETGAGGLFDYLNFLIRCQYYPFHFVADGWMGGWEELDNIH